MPTDRTNAERQARRREQYNAMREALRVIAESPQACAWARGFARGTLEGMGPQQKEKPE